MSTPSLETLLEYYTSLSSSWSTTLPTAYFSELQPQNRLSLFCSCYELVILASTPAAGVATLDSGTEGIICYLPLNLS